VISVTVSPQSETPIYQQLYEQIAAQIVRGDLESGAALPPIRTMAKELRVSVITVKKAWESLERDGLIYGVVGRGSFVADLSTADRTEKRANRVLGALRRDITRYRDMGITLDELVDWVREVYEEDT
jgi:GntR family transcriptional regulator